MKIACIGSREINPQIESEMEHIGEFIARQGWWLASGNAIGSDQAYARGANRVNPTKVILYLPWSTYEDQAIVEGNQVLESPKPEWEELAARHHPRYPLLGQGAQKMMVRNAGIVRNADAVIAYLNRRKIGGGGTGHGARIASALEIPLLDISLPKNLAHAIEFLRETCVARNAP